MRLHMLDKKPERQYLNKEMNLKSDIALAQFFADPNLIQTKYLLKITTLIDDSISVLITTSV